MGDGATEGVKSSGEGLPGPASESGERVWGASEVAEEGR